MFPNAEILDEAAEVTLRKINLVDGYERIIDSRYVVYSRRTPEEWPADNYADARKYFDLEVARCIGGKY